MVPHLACPINEASQVGDARRQAVRLAASLGFDELAKGRVALVVTELANNLARHAQDGLLLVGAVSRSGVHAIELVSVDRGPGMGDIGHALADGVSTAGTAGTGLGAVRRLSSQFNIFSKRGAGTVIVARLTADNSALTDSVGKPGTFGWAGLCVAAPGETVSGDSWAVRDNGRQMTLLLADGLGHGPDAAAAADAAVRVFQELGPAPCEDVLARCHAVLRSTRGAAVAVLDVDSDSRAVTACAAGNIVARVITGVTDRALMSQHGTVGLQVRKFQPMRSELPEYALLVVHSDGIASRWDLSGVPELLTADPILVAAYLIRHHLRGRDDATVLVVRCH